MSLSVADFRELEEIEVRKLGAGRPRITRQPEIGGRAAFAPELLSWPDHLFAYWNGSDIVLLPYGPASRYRVECYAPEIRGYIARRVA